MSGISYVDTNGIRLAYRERGQGEPLVLIMGLGADGPVWEDHVRHYERHFRCFLVDNRGSGASDKPAGPYTTAQMADDYAGLIRSLQLGAVRVVGISMGGAIAQQLALRHPQLVRRQVLACSWARCDVYATWIFEHFAAVRAAVPPSEFMRVLHLWIWSPSWVAAHRDELQCGQEAALSAPPMPQHAFVAQCRACTTHDTSDQLSRITTPTLVTVGDQDIFTPPAFSRDLAARIPGARLEVLPDTGHAHHWEALDAFNELTTRWLLAT